MAKNLKDPGNQKQKKDGKYNLDFLLKNIRVEIFILNIFINKFNYKKNY